MKIKLLLIIIAAVLFGAACASIATYLIVTSNRPEDNKPPDLDPNQKDYQGKDPEDKGGVEQGIKIPGYGTIYFHAGKTDVKMILLNPEGNPCYFTFELVVDGVSYYTSGLVEPSKCIEDFKLTKPIPKGDYKAVLKIRAFSLDKSLAPMNGANVTFDLIVQ